MGDLRRFWGVLGVFWRRLREVFSTGWPPEGPRERFGRIWAPFWMDLGGHFGSFWHNFRWFLWKFPGKREQSTSKARATREQIKSNATAKRSAERRAKRKQSNSKATAKRKQNENKAKAKRQQSESKARAKRKQRESKARATRKQSESAARAKRKPNAKQKQN